MCLVHLSNNFSLPQSNYHHWTVTSNQKWWVTMVCKKSISLIFCRDMTKFWSNYWQTLSNRQVEQEKASSLCKWSGIKKCTDLVGTCFQAWSNQMILTNYPNHEVISGAANQQVMTRSWPHYYTLWFNFLQEIRQSSSV